MFRFFQHGDDAAATKAASVLRLPKVVPISAVKRCSLSSAAIGITVIVVAEGVRTTDPSSCFDLPEATFVQDEEDQAHQHGSVTSSIKPDLANDPMLSEAGLVKMKDRFCRMY